MLFCSLALCPIQSQLAVHMKYSPNTLSSAGGACGLGRLSACYQHSQGLMPILEFLVYIRCVPQSSCTGFKGIKGLGLGL